MSFLDSLFGTNTSAGTQAAVGNAVGGLYDGLTSANAALRNNANKAIGALNTGAAGATTALNTGYDAGRADLLNFGGKAQDALTAGVDKGVSTVLSGNQGFQPFLSSGTGANTMLANSYGLNGAAGNDAATAAFRASPGYAFQVDQGVDAAARKAASLGIAASGNTMDAVTRLSSNLADQEYGAWRSGLAGLSNSGLTAASGISGNTAAAGGMQYGAGGTLAQMFSNLGTSTAGLNVGKGTGRANISSNLGNALAGTYGDLGRGLSSNNLGTALNAGQFGIAGGQAADSAENASNAALSKLFGSVLGLPLGGGAINPGGLSIAPSGSGAFTISPSAASSSGHGVLGALGFKI